MQPVDQQADPTAFDEVAADPEDTSAGVSGNRTAPPDRPGVLEWATRGLCIALLLGFGWVVFGYVFSDGLCCADDSYISMAAKNLADGVGYATSYPVYGEARIYPFDPGITTGPTLVLPAAAVIAVFGNTPWAPGFAAASISALVLLFLILAVRRIAGTTRALLLAACFVFLLYCASAGRPVFSQWYVLLGEAAAALLTLLGMAVLAWNPESRRWVFLSGVCLGLALTSKTLAIVLAIPAFGYLLARVVLGRGQRTDRFWLLLAAAVGYLLPTALFELWKLVYFGGADYLVNLREWLDFYTIISSGGDAPLSEKLASYVSYFPFSLLILLTAVAVVAVLLTVDRRTPVAALRLFWLVVAAALLAFGYFLVAAPNNPRYALFGMILGLFAVACVCFSRARPLVTIGLAVILVLPFVPPMDQLREPIRATIAGGYRPSDRVANLELTAKWLEENQTDQPFIANWWATIDDVEYMMPTAVNFEKWEDVPPEQLSGRVLVRNRNFSDRYTSPEFQALEARCPVVLLNAHPYLVTLCP